MRSSHLHVTLFGVALLLTGCGDGWEVQRTSEIFPYGNQRTAGSGVMYVRAKMLPEKEIVVEQEKAPEAIKPADEVFAQAQTKGVSAKPVNKKVVENKPEKAVSEEVKKEDVRKDVKDKKKSLEDAKEKSEVVPAAGEQSSAPVIEKKVEKTSDTKIAPRKSYEQMLDENQGKSKIEPQKVEPEAGNIIGDQTFYRAPPPPNASLEIVEVPEEKMLEKNSGNRSVMPVKEIRSPMMDIYNRDYEAEKSLEEIYSNPF